MFDQILGAMFYLFIYFLPYHFTTLTVNAIERGGEVGMYFPSQSISDAWWFCCPEADSVAGSESSALTTGLLRQREYERGISPQTSLESTQDKHRFIVQLHGRIIYVYYIRLLLDLYIFTIDLYTFIYTRLLLDLYKFTVGLYTFIYTFLIGLVISAVDNLSWTCTSAA